MKDTENNRKRGKWGFTLAELLVVVAIITILAGVSFVAVLRYQSRLRRLEMDQTAKEIFLAAQNRLSLESSQGIMARLLEQGESEKKLGIKASDSDAVYVVLYDGGENDSTGEIRERLLPFGSIDETVRTDGNYLVFYEPGTGSVRGVWYSDRYQFVREDIGSENGFAEQTTLLRVMDRQSDIMAVRALGVEISRQRRSFSRSPWSFLTGRSSM